MMAKTTKNNLIKVCIYPSPYARLWLQNGGFFCLLGPLYKPV
jgi:hypothetical protein